MLEFAVLSDMLFLGFDHRLCPSCKKNVLFRPDWESPRTKDSTYVHVYIHIYKNVYIYIYIYIYICTCHIKSIVYNILYLIHCI